MTTPSSGGRAAEALLDQLQRDAFDDDYYADRPVAPRRFSRLLSAVTLLAFGLLISTAAIQSRTDRPASALERAAVIEDIESREQQVATQRDLVESLTAEIDALHEAVREPGADHRLLILAADQPAAGPGVVITARSGERGQRAQISDIDLQLLVNGLWYAGAEAVAINGQRLGSMTAIRWAGESVTVNYRSLREPYEVAAIGPASMAENWTANPSGRHWQQRADASGVRFQLAVDDELALPPVPRARLRLTHATVVEDVS